MALNKTAIVTGAGSGIGKQVALRLAAAGTNVIIVGRREKALVSVAAESKSDRIRVCVADVSLPAGRQAIQAAVGDAPVHLLIHNAGVNPVGHLRDVDVEAFRSSMAINTEAPIFLTQALVPNLKAAGGDARILLVSSGAGDMHVPSMGVYCVQKAALKMVWTVLKDELAEVAAVGYMKPGLVNTEMTDQMMAHPGFLLKDFLGPRFEGGDAHSAEDIAEWVCALCDEARCPRKTFIEREHNVDLAEHQLGVSVRLTTEGKLFAKGNDNYADTWEEKPSSPQMFWRFLSKLGC